MGNPRSIELFDSRGHFVLPSPEAIQELDPETQQRFAAVQEAALEAEAATAARKAAEHFRDHDAINERDAARKDELRLRPPVTAVQAAKDWIASQRAE
jgi:hypothetical protein